MGKQCAPELPDPLPRTYAPYRIDHPGNWLILADVHIPYHDKKVVELAVNEAKKSKAAGVLLNGDAFDFHAISRFDKEPTKARYISEVGSGVKFLAYLRDRLPKARIVFKEGNHEERLRAYLMQKADELFELPEIQLPALMKFDKYGVDHVGERRVIRLGKLNVIHGHEFRPQIQTPVNPARGLYLRAKSRAMCGHFHQTSEHQEKDITGKHEAAWSLGCACHLSPDYMPLNKWNHGFAVVSVAKDGDFSVRNMKVIEGRLY